MQLALRLLPLLAVAHRRPAHVLAAELGVDRQRLAATVALLRELGVGIDGDDANGYQLLEAVQLLDAERVRAGLSGTAAACLQGLEILAEIDSTNRYLLGARRPGVHACLAERQSAGRGRRGRTWASPFARGLYLSVRWPTARPLTALSGLSLAVGVAVAEALHTLGATTVGLKWPNDLIAGDAKLGGVLIELASGGTGDAAVVVGLGINGALGTGAPGLDQPWTDLGRVLGAPPDRNRLAAAALDALLDALRQFETRGFAPFRARYTRFDRLAGREVRVDGEPPLAGVARGVDEDGALLVETGGTCHRVIAGDVSVRVGERDRQHA